jgi:D-methionine transport system ATP-binding protein
LFGGNDVENPIISVKNLTKIYNEKSNPTKALSDINLDIQKGDIYGIIGMSGAGKSTLVRCLNFLEKPTEGTVVVQGKDLSSLSGKELRKARTEISMIFQHFNLLMQKNVEDNVCFPLKINKVSKSEAKKRCSELLEIVGLSDKAKAYPSQLSGGQKQRVAIARALATNPKILLCDEATSALDPQTTKSILNLLKDINKKYGITIVVITHEMSVIQEICNKVAVLELGSMVERGTVEELFRSPKTEAAKRLVYSGTTYVESMTSGRKVRVTFEGNSSFEPIIGNIILECKTPVNILYANTRNVNGKAMGEMILQLPDSDEIADKMIDYFKSKNLGVKELTEDD